MPPKTAKRHRSALDSDNDSDPEIPPPPPSSSHDRVHVASLDDIVEDVPSSSPAATTHKKKKFAKNDVIIIADPSVVQYYKDNPGLDPTIVNITFIDIMKKLSQNMGSSMINASMAQLLNQVRDLHAELAIVKHDSAAAGLEHAHQIQTSLRSVADDLKSVARTSAEKYESNVANAISANNPIITCGISSLFKEIASDITSVSHEHLAARLDAGICDVVKAVGGNGNLSETINLATKSLGDELSRTIASVGGTTATNICADVNALSKTVHLLSGAEERSATKVLADRMSTFLERYSQNSSVKGSASESELVQMLESILPGDEIVRTTSQVAAGDVHVNRRSSTAPALLFELKNYTRSVPSDEVAKFKRDVQQQKRHGIMISQTSGIALRTGFQVEVEGGLIHVFVTHANHSAEKIKIAVDMVDSLHTQLAIIENTKMVQTNGGISIPQIEMLDIANEYTEFGQKKMRMLDTLKDMTNRMEAAINDIQLPVLRKALVSVGTLVDVSGLECEFCPWRGKNRSSLAAHRRRCKAALTNTSSSQAIEIEIAVEDDDDAPSPNEVSHD